MRKISFLALGLSIGLIGGFGYFLLFPTTSAQKAARNQWEYAAIKAVYTFSPSRDRLNRIYGMAEICYFQPTGGCKRAEVKQELDYGEFLQQRALAETYASRNQASLAASEIAFQKALTQLGGEGWEIVGEPDLKFEFVSIDEFNKYEDKSLLFNREGTKAVYFKRLKIQ